MHVRFLHRARGTTIQPYLAQNVCYSSRCPYENCSKRSSGSSINLERVREKQQTNVVHTMVGSPYAKCASSRGKWEYKNLEKFENLERDQEKWFRKSWRNLRNNRIKATIWAWFTSCYKWQRVVSSSVMGIITMCRR